MKLTNITFDDQNNKQKIYIYIYFFLILIYLKIILTTFQNFKDQNMCLRVILVYIRNSIYL